MTDGVADIYPLTPMQRGMLFHTLFAPRSGVYICQTTCTITGELDVEAFRAAWQAVVDRHAVLRTAFVWKKTEEPRQIVMRRAALPFELQDLSGVEDREARFDALVQADKERGFDLHKPPLMRLVLVSVGPSSYRLLWSHHHLLLDGWSAAIVLRDVFAAYRPGRSPIELQPAPPFGEYVQWLRRQDLSSAESVWRPALAGFVCATKLAIDRATPGVLSPDGEYRAHPFKASPRLVSKLQSLARELRTTVAVIVQCAWGLVLVRHCGEDDVLFGATVSGRSVPVTGIDEMVGLFINTLPVRLTLGRQDTAAGIIQRLHAEQLALRELEFTPLTVLRRWSEVPPGKPLFESIVVFENYPVEEHLRGGTAEAKISDVSSQEQINYPLTLVVHPGSEMSLLLAYDERRFEPAAIERLAQHVIGALEAIAEAPQAPAATLDIMTPGERREVLEMSRPHGMDRPARSAHDLFAQVATSMGDRVAAEEGSQTLTYGELLRRSLRVAAALGAAGSSTGRPIALLLPRCLELLPAMMGVLFSGAPFVPLDPEAPPERIQEILSDTGATLAITRRDVEVPLSAARVLYVEDLMSGSEIAPIQGVTGPRDPAYVIYTSGSTGRPKGVVLLHGGLVNNALTLAERFGLEPGRRVLQFSSVSFDGCVGDVFSTLLSGATLCLESHEAAMSATTFFRLVRGRAVTNITAPPSFLAALPHEELPALATIACVGEACPTDVVDVWQPGRRFLNGYGPTETTICAAISDCVANGEPPAIGAPTANVEAYVLDEYLRPVPFGVPGELYLSGAGLARGYLGDPAMTASRFVPHPLSRVSGARMYRTGDVVRWRQDGQLVFVRRADDQVKLRGYRVELGEVESVLAEHSGVQEVAVAVRGDASSQRALIAYYVPKQGDAPTADDLRAIAERRLPDYMLPVAYVPVEQMPRTASGKVNRRALPEWSGDRPELGSEYVAPRTPSERRLTALWQSVLGVVRVGIRDDFFEFGGGDSLLAVRMISEVERAFGCELPISLVFQQPTVEALARELDERGGGKEVDLGDEVSLSEEIRPSGTRRLAGSSFFERVFLTGATGYVGAFMLEQLLARTSAKVHCLVRAASRAEGMRRIRLTLASFGIDRPDVNDRVVVHAGDISRANLGLSSAEWGEVAEMVGAIYHAAAHVHYLHPYARLKTPNVNGTQEALRLATTGPSKPFHHVSTLGVFSVDYRGRTAKESELRPDPTNLHLIDAGYVQTKWVAEQIVLLARERGVAAHVYRLGDVSGDSRSGASNPSDMLRLGLQACIELRCAPARDVTLDLAPADYVASALVELSRTDHETPVLHLNNPLPVSLQEVFTTVASLGYEIEIVEPKEWARRMGEAARRSGGEGFRRLLALLGEEHGDGATAGRSWWSYDCAEAARRLSPTGVQCPAIDRELISRYLAYLVRTGYIPPPI